MNRLTAIGLASLVAYGLLIATKYTGVVSAAREDRSADLGLNDAQIAGSAVIGKVASEPQPVPLSLPPPVPRAEQMRASPSGAEFRSARDECQFTTAGNEDLGTYSAKQRRQFLLGLTAGDPNNAKRIAAYDAVDN